PQAIAAGSGAPPRRRPPGEPVASQGVTAISWRRTPQLGSETCPAAWNGKSPSRRSHSWRLCWKTGTCASIAGGARDTACLSPFPAGAPPAAAILDRLAHEYALRDDLEAGWAARPLFLLREHGRSLLVLEDPGGVPLTQLVGGPMETRRFLRLAVQLVQAVGK